MYYEVYADTLFLVNFVMNLYVLLLTNSSVGRTATRLRMVGAAVLGAFIYLLGLVSGLPLFGKLFLQIGGSAVLMTKTAFRPKTYQGYKKLLETMLSYSLLLGGSLYLPLRYIKGIGEYSTGIAFVAGMGGIFFLFFSFLTERKKERGLCRVTLISGTRTVSVNALLDTGNGLVEPVSQSPVSVADGKVLEQLWPEGMPELFRAIPYHSVGKAGGIMKGYLVEKMIVEQEGIPGCYEQVYVAAGEEKISAKGKYELILNPSVLQSRQTRGEWRKI